MEIHTVTHTYGGICTGIDAYKNIDEAEQRLARLVQSADEEMEDFNLFTVKLQ